MMDLPVLVCTGSGIVQHLFTLTHFGSVGGDDAGQLQGNRILEILRLESNRDILDHRCG
jgi:hypothetical protein